MQAGFLEDVSAVYDPLSFPPIRSTVGHAPRNSEDKEWLGLPPIFSLFPFVLTLRGPEKSIGPVCVHPVCGALTSCPASLLFLAPFTPYAPPFPLWLASPLGTKNAMVKGPRPVKLLRLSGQPIWPCRQAFSFPPSPSPSNQVRIGSTSPAFRGTGVEEV